MRTRLWGGVGAGGLKPPATRFFSDGRLKIVSVDEMTRQRTESRRKGESPEKLMPFFLSPKVEKTKNKMTSDKEKNVQDFENLGDNPKPFCLQPTLRKERYDNRPARCLRVRFYWLVGQIFICFLFPLTI